MLPIFKLGLGGPFGNGERWTSWVSIDDAISGIYHAVYQEGITGAFNLTAPEPVMNSDVCAALGMALGRPIIATVPPIVLRSMLGQMAEETLLSDLRVLPQALQNSGYTFRQPTITSALRHALGTQGGF